MNTVAAAKKRLIARLNPGNWSIKWKIRINFLLRAVLAIGLIVLVVNMLLRKIAIQEANDKLLLLTETKSKYIEDYFTHINQQLSTFSTDKQTVDAFNQLGVAFLNIENDNYLTADVPDMNRLNSLVEGFYKAEILPALESETTTAVNLASLLPGDNKQRILQYLYLAANQKPIGFKGTINKADDGSAYSYMHAQYHPEMIKFARKAGISDIIFVDYKTGYVTYSLEKNLDFATNLYEGPYKNSGLGMAFKKAIGQPVQGSVTCVDESLYAPALFQPSIFMSTPLFDGNQILGVVVFAINSSLLDNLLMFDKEELSSGESLKTIIIGDDFLYRSNDPEFVADREKYLHKLKRNANNGETAIGVARLGTTALLQSVDHVTLANASQGKEGLARYTTETGESVLCSYIPLKINNLNWILIAQMNKSGALASVHSMLKVLIGLAILIAILLYYISVITSNAISGRLNQLRDIVVSLAKGQHIKVSEAESDDEIGQMMNAASILNRRINESASFVTELGKGNMDMDFSVTGDEDNYGNSLDSLKKSLVLRRDEEENRKKEDEIRNWTTHGIALFNDIMRTDNSNLEKLSFSIIKNLIQYLSANQGGIFLIDEDENSQYFNLVAAYAYDRQKFMKKRIEIGEGLAGTCILEKKTILPNKIPDDYITITSGLGGAKPGCLLIVPLKKDEEVLGVIEVASFNSMKPHEVEFVEKIAESIASGLITVRLHLQTTQYLERFQQQSEEMKAQDEELRQNIEEMQATHEQLERLQHEEKERSAKALQEINEYRNLLISVLNEIPEEIFLKDDKGRFIMANKPVADKLNKTVDEILGKTVFDLYSREEATKYHQLEKEIIESGKAQSIEEGDASKDEGHIVRSIKKPFYIEYLGITGLFGVQFDISDMKRKEYEANKLVDEIQGKQKELRDEMALMDALLHNVPESIYFKDKNSKFIRFSKSMLKLFGLKKAEELIGKSDFDFFDEEHARPAFNDEQNIMKTGKAIIDLEEKEVLVDGTVNWVNTTKMPLRDSDGEIIGTFGISKNITHLKKLQQEAIERNEEIEAQEEEMRQNLEEMLATQEGMKCQLEENAKIQEALGKEKALMDALLNNVPESIYFKDKQSKFIRFSQSMLKLFGLKKAEELVGKSPILISLMKNMPGLLLTLNRTS